MPRGTCPMPSMQSLMSLPLSSEDGASRSARRLFRELGTFTPCPCHRDQLQTRCWEEEADHGTGLGFQQQLAATLCSGTWAEAQVALFLTLINLHPSFCSCSLTVGGSAVSSLLGLKLSSPSSEYPSCACNLLGATCCSFTDRICYLSMEKRSEIFLHGDIASFLLREVSFLHGEEARVISP